MPPRVPLGSRLLRLLNTTSDIARLIRGERHRWVITGGVRPAAAAAARSWSPLQAQLVPRPMQPLPLRSDCPCAVAVS
jgi:hypothetical protein